MADSVLSGLHVVNTRAQHQATELTDELEAHGATVLPYPAIAIEPPPDSAALDRALHAAADGAFDWLLLTSSNTVHALQERLSALQINSEALRQLHVAAIGSATAAAAETELHVAVDLLPDEYESSSLAEAIPVKPGQRVFLPQSAIARPLLANKLREAGAEVTAVIAYRTLVGRGGVHLPEHFWRGDVDAVTFTSSSTVHNFMRRLKRENGSAAMLVDVVVACIGPVTAEAARAHDLAVQVVPEEHTVAALVESLVAYFERRMQ